MERLLIASDHLFHRFQNIRGSLYNVNLRWHLALGLYVLARLWPVSDVELGKDEAVHLYWGQHFDASYALLPFFTIKLTHGFWPHQE